MAYQDWLLGDLKIRECMIQGDATNTVEKTYGFAMYLYKI